MEPADLTTTFSHHQKRALMLRLEPIQQRKKLLKKLEGHILANRDRIGKAVYQDLGKSPMEVDLSEIYPVVGEIRHALEKLDEWTAPQKVDAPISYLGTRSKKSFSNPRGFVWLSHPGITHLVCALAR